MSHMRYRKICIVGLDSYGLLSGEGDLRYIGGETVQPVSWHSAAIAGCRLGATLPISSRNA